MVSRVGSNRSGCTLGEQPRGELLTSQVVVSWRTQGWPKSSLANFVSIDLDGDIVETKVLDDPNHTNGENQAQDQSA